MVSELAQYIIDRQRSGKSNETIREELRESGWSEEEMAEAFNEAYGASEESKLKTYSVATVVLLLVFSVALYGATQLTGAVVQGSGCLVEDVKSPGSYEYLADASACQAYLLETICKDGRPLRLGKGTVDVAHSCSGRGTSVHFLD